MPTVLVKTFTTHPPLCDSGWLWRAGVGTFDHWPHSPMISAFADIKDKILLLKGLDESAPNHSNHFSQYPLSGRVVHDAKGPRLIL